MVEPFDEEEDELPEVLEERVLDTYQSSSFEARRRLERLLAEKQLRDELEDF